MIRDNQLYWLLLICIIVVFAVSFSSCERDPDELGLAVLPGEDNFIIQTDTLYDILGSTVKRDSILSFDPDSGIKVFYNSILGDYTDATFGNSKASLLLNFYPDLDSANQSFGTNPGVDSLVFYLSYHSVLGNSNMHFKIFELNKYLSYIEKYYSNINPDLFTDRLIKDTIIQFKDTLLRIKITDPDLLNKLINIPSTAQENLAAFQNYFKGFHIETQAESGNGVLAYVNPWSYTSPSKLVLYYKNDVEDSLFFNYNVEVGTVRVNKFSHTYTFTPVAAALLNPEPGQNITYVQGMGGVGTRIRIPSLASWVTKKPVSVNKAELVIPVDITNADTLFRPQRLSMMAVSPQGVYSSIEYGFGQTFIGGIYDRSKKVFTFNLAKHLQKIANGLVENTDLIIVADGYRSNVTNSLSQVTLDFSPGKGAKLSIIYSKL